jgi:MoxR-like ATPase
MRACRARALLAGRDFVSPDDVKLLAVPALGHRLTLKPETWVRNLTGDDVVGELVGRVATPPTVL